MKTLTSQLRRSVVFAALPAALAFSSCSDDKADPTPDQGRVVAIHAAPNANVKVSVFADDQLIKDLAYGESSGYQLLNTGSKTFKVNIAGNTSSIATATQTISKDKNYSLFAYSNTTQTGSVALLPVEDDLTAPGAGKAKIRLVHLGLGAASPVTLNKSEASGVPVVLAQNVSFGQFSSFTEVAAGEASLYLSGPLGTPIPPFITKTLTAGKIYTVLVQGSTTAGSIDANLGTKIVFIENN